MKYFSSDTHFNHVNIIKSCNRPFENVWEMNARMIKIWNDTVNPRDEVYHLGDFAYPKNNAYGMPIDEIIDKLHGQITLIRGCHDRYVKKYEHLFHQVKDLAYIKLSSGDKCMLCHYPMRTWRASHYGSFMLHGHSHCQIKPVGKMIDVGVDCWNFRPISEHEIMEIMKGRERNENML